MDYLKALTQPSVSILLGGKELRVRRANLGLHYRLSMISDQWQEARRTHGHREMVELTYTYITLATGLDIEIIKQASVVEVLFSYTLLISLNRPRGDLPFMRSKPRKDEYQYEYDNRALANWVSILAHHYGWTTKHILDHLTPEEVACYMQEALLQDHEDKEFMYKLSDAAYTTVGKGSSARTKYVPFPRPPWMAKEPPKIRIPKSWIPQGNVIEASDIGRAADNA